MRLIKTLKSTPIQLVIALSLGFIFGDMLSDNVISGFYTASLVLKDILMTVLPVIIFAYISSAILSFKENAPLLILGIFICVILSNLAAVFVSFGVGHLVLPSLCCTVLKDIGVAPDIIKPLINFSLPKIFSTDYAMMSAVLVGFGVNTLGSIKIKNISTKIAYTLRDASTVFLRKMFVPVLPIYVFGFVMKLDREDALDILVKNYASIFMVSITLILLYLTVAYLIAAGFNAKRFLGYLREMLPAGMTGFSTMSSAATMPVTISATEKNIEDATYADFIIPATTNIHMIGDGLNIILTAMALLLMSGANLPTLAQFSIFAFFYCLAKFSGTGVPGGGVIVILPVVQKYLGLSPELSTLLATIYILQDAIMTSTNVMMNGAFAIMTHKLFQRIGLVKTQQSPSANFCEA
jgi:Na+/H+-dicarboxylate symporter